MPNHSKPSATWLNAFAGNAGRKPWGSFVLAFVLIVLVGGLLWGARAFTSASQWVAHTNQARVDVENLLVSLNEAESAHRGWLLSGDSDMRRQSLIAQGKALDLARTLPEVVSDNPPQKLRAQRLRLLVEERFHIIEEVATIYERDGFAKAHARWLAMKGHNTLPQETRDLALSMVEEEHRLLALRQQDTRQMAWLVEVLALAGMSVAIALVILTGLAYRREARIRDRSARATQAAHDQIALNLASMERSHRATQGLADFASLLQGCQTIEEIFQVSMHSIEQILPGTSGTFYLMRASRDHAEAQADWGITGKTVLPVLRQASVGACARGAHFVPASASWRVPTPSPPPWTDPPACP